MEWEFHRILEANGFSPERAATCARLFAENTLDGVYTHGIDRFPRFIEYVRKGFVRPDAEARKVHSAGALEQWDGQLGPGPLNALACTARAAELARLHGIGCVGLANTNHWMRGGSYGWKAAREGFCFIGWTNTIANMPAWGASDARLGNNPLVLAVPHGEEAVVLDMAMSQFSYGSIELHARRGLQLRVPGGYDGSGELTTDPDEIIESRRLLPAGYWKGSGLALLLDLLATLLSGGSSTLKISKQKAEYAVSQVFVCMDPSRLGNASFVAGTVREVIDDLHRSFAAQGGTDTLYPGERVLRTRRENLAEGIPVEEDLWNAVRAL
jgi:3-dehydro-L-gulonate 2-dehydrogenase